MNNHFGLFSEESLAAYQEALAEQAGTDFAESDSYDFTTCIRPDGSAYGTDGTCRKGREGEAKAAAKDAQALRRNANRGSAGEDKYLKALKNTMERASEQGGESKKIHDEIKEIFAARRANGGRMDPSQRKKLMERSIALSHAVEAAAKKT
jgi:hypothetical protein